MLRPLISPSQLSDCPAGSVRLLDARSGPEARRRYQAGHLPGALFADLEHDLARPAADAAQGGRHPLPPLADFARQLGEWGIGPGTRVVLYDDKSGANAAARLWWMLRSVGHDAVQVLDGGLAAAEAAGFSLSSEAGDIAPLASYPALEWQLPLASLAEVKAASEGGGTMIIDVREAYRYRGEAEPIDLVAGHIPGAVNVPYAGSLDAAGQFLPPLELWARYNGVLAGRHTDQVIVHCGSGVTACHTLLAFAHAGLALPRLYVGSWSEWSRNGLPIATEQE